MAERRSRPTPIPVRELKYHRGDRAEGLRPGDREHHHPAGRSAGCLATRRRSARRSRSADTATRTCSSVCRRDHRGHQPPVRRARTAVAAPGAFRYCPTPRRGGKQPVQAVSRRWVPSLPLQCMLNRPAGPHDSGSAFCGRAGRSAIGALPACSSSSSNPRAAAGSGSAGAERSGLRGVGKHGPMFPSATVSAIRRSPEQTSVPVVW